LKTKKKTVCGIKKIASNSFIEIYLDSWGYKSWFISIKNIFRFLKMDHILYTSDVIVKNMLTK